MRAGPLPSLFRIETLLPLPNSLHPLQVKCLFSSLQHILQAEEEMIRNPRPVHQPDGLLRNQQTGTPQGNQTRHQCDLENKPSNKRQLASLVAQCPWCSARSLSVRKDEINVLPFLSVVNSFVCPCHQPKQNPHVINPRIHPTVEGTLLSHVQNSSPLSRALFVTGSLV